MINKYDYDHDDQTTRDNKTKGQKNKRDKQTKRTKREIYIVMSGQFCTLAMMQQ